MPPCLLISLLDHSNFSATLRLWVRFQLPNIHSSSMPFESSALAFLKDADEKDYRVLQAHSPRPSGEVPASGNNPHRDARPHDSPPCGMGVTTQLSRSHPSTNPTSPTCRRSCSPPCASSRRLSAHALNLPSALAVPSGFMGARVCPRSLFSIRFSSFGLKDSSDYTKSVRPIEYLHLQKNVTISPTHTALRITAQPHRLCLSPQIRNTPTRNIKSLFWESQNSLKGSANKPSGDTKPPLGLKIPLHGSQNAPP